MECFLFFPCFNKKQSYSLLSDKSMKAFKVFFLGSNAGLKANLQHASVSVKWSNATVLCLLWDSKSICPPVNSWIFMFLPEPLWLSEICPNTDLWTEGKSEIQLTDLSSVYSLILITLLTVAHSCFSTPFYLSGPFIMSVLVNSLSEENHVVVFPASCRWKVSLASAFLRLKVTKYRRSRQWMDKT